MKHLNRYTALFTLSALLVCLLASCGGKSPVESTPAETTASEETTALPEEARVNVSFSVVDQDGNSITEAVLTVLPDSEEGESALLNTDGEGKCSVSLPTGSYTVRFDVLPEYVLGIDTPITVTEDMEPVILTVTNNTPNGTEARPFVINDSTATVTVPAGETYHFTLFGGSNRTLTMESPNAEITYNDTVYAPDENGVISVRLVTESQRDHVFFALKNTASEATEMTISLVSDPGTMDNPMIIEVLGEAITAQVPQEGMVYYKWTATASGTLKVSSSDSINNISLNNITTSRVSDFTEGKEVETLAVSEGDIVTVVVSVIGGDRNAEFNPVTFTLTLEE